MHDFNFSNLVFGISLVCGSAGAATDPYAVHWTWDESIVEVPARRAQYEQAGEGYPAGELGW